MHKEGLSYFASKGKEAQWHDNGGNFAVSSEGGSWIQFDPFEAKRLWESLNKFLLANSKNREALLMGGPRHGEFFAIPPGQNSISFFHQHLPDTIFFSNDAAPNMVFKTHVYTKQSDFGIDGRRTWMPFDIFEHQSLSDENVERKAKRLDAAQAAASQREKEASEEYLAAVEARDAAYQRWTEAAAKTCQITNERDQLQFEFGV